MLTFSTWDRTFQDMFPNSDANVYANVQIMSDISVYFQRLICFMLGELYQTLHKPWNNTTYFWPPKILSNTHAQNLYAASLDASVCIQKTK